MSKESQSRLQQIISDRPKAGTAKSSLSLTTYVNFQDWLFFGTSPNVFAQVGVTPVAGTTSIEYVLIVIEVPSGPIVCDAALNTNNAQAGWTVNLATDTGIYDLSTLGNQVEVWAFAQALVGGVLQSEYSATQYYTVS